MRFQAIASFFLAGALAVPVSVFGQSTKLVPSGPATSISGQMGERVAVWSGNALVVAQGPLTDPVAFAAFDRSGATVFSAALSVPGAASNGVRSWARAADGVVAVCGLSLAKDGRGAPFIAWFSPDGDSEHIIRTEPYLANLIAFAPDGTIWTVGHDLNAHLSEKGVNPDAGVVRHFDRAGKALDTFVPRSSFQNPVHLSSNSGHLAVAAGRVGWIHYIHLSGFRVEGAYVEISSAGEATTYPLPFPQAWKAPDVGGFAMTDSGEVFATAFDRAQSGGQSTVFRLDRTSKAWQSVALPALGATEQLGELYGANGSELVFGVKGPSSATIRFLALAPGS
jgi:hypothetical protein